MRRYLLILACFVLSGWSLFQSAVRLVNYGDAGAVLAGDERAVINRPRFPGGAIYQYLEKNLRKDEKTLVFRQSDFTLYGTGTWLDNFDTDLTAVYQMTSVEEAFAWFRQRGVRYALLPDYTNPTYYRTVVGKLLSDPRLTEPVMVHRGYRLLRLFDEPQDMVCDPLPGEPAPLQVLSASFGFQGLLGAIAGLPGLAGLGGATDGKLADVTVPMWRTQQQLSASDRAELHWAPRGNLSVITGTGWPTIAPNQASLRLTGRHNLLISVDMSGLGFMAIDLVEYLSNGEVVQTRYWDGLIDDKTSQASFLAATNPEARSIRLRISNPGRAPGDVSLRNLSICKPRARSQPAVSQQDMQGPSAILSTHRFTPACGPAEDKNWLAERWCRSEETSFFVERIGPETVVHGFVGRLSSNGFHFGLWFEYQRYLESARVLIDRYPDSTRSQLLKPVYDLLSGKAPGHFSEKYEIELTGYGAGTHSVYVQWTDANGDYQYRYAGQTYFDKTTATLRLPVDLPRDMANPQIGLVGAGTSASIAEAKLMRVSR